MTTLTTSRSDASSLSISGSSLVLTLLALLTVMGSVAGLGRLFLGLGATTALSDGYSWGIWIAFDFVLIAFAGAGFTMTGLVHVLHLEQFHPAVRPAVLAGLLGYGAVLLLLVLDLGRPDRFYHFMLYWNLHSPLFEISCCVLLYSTILFIECSPFVLERLGWARAAHWLHRLTGPLAIIGVTLSSLHQSTLGTLYLNMPHRLDSLWYSPALPLLFFVSSVMAGLSLALVAYSMACYMTGQPIQPALWRGLAKGAAWVTLLYLLLKLGELGLAGEWPKLLSFNPLSQLWGWEVGLGAAAPLLLALIPAVRRHHWGRWVGPGLILLGVLANRFNATMFAQTPPPGTPPYSPHPVEWLTTLGILAGVALVWAISVRWLALFERPQRI